jgi:hypothetical protein
MSNYIVVPATIVNGITLTNSDISGMFIHSTTIPNNSGIITNYTTKYGVNTYDLATIYNVNTVPYPVKPFTTGYNATIGGTLYDISQILSSTEVVVVQPPIVGVNGTTQYPSGHTLVTYTWGATYTTFKNPTTITAKVLCIGPGGGGGFATAGAGGGGGGGICYASYTFIANTIYYIFVGRGQGPLGSSAMQPSWVSTVSTTGNIITCTSGGIGTNAGVGGATGTCSIWPITYISKGIGGAGGGRGGNGVNSYTENSNLNIDQYIVNAGVKTNFSGGGAGGTSTRGGAAAGFDNKKFNHGGLGGVGYMLGLSNSKGGNGYGEPSLPGDEGYGCGAGGGGNQYSTTSASAGTGGPGVVYIWW